MATSACSELVSVIVPAYNAVKTLGETLRSACAQQGVELEVLVVDDGSTDGSAELAASFGPPVRVLRQTNAGVGAARNRGLAEARGRWIAFLDADDLWEPDKLSRQLELLRARGKAYGFCYTGIELIDAHGSALEHVAWSKPGMRPEGWVFRRLLLGGNFVTTSSVLVLHEIVKQVGQFVTERTFSEDYDMWLRLARRTPFTYVPRPLVRYRFDPVSYSHADPQKAGLRSLHTFEHAAKLAGMGGLRDRAALRVRRAAIFYELGYTLGAQGKLAPAAYWLLRSLGQAPLATPAGLHLAKLALPGRVRSLLRRVRRGRVRPG